MIEGPIPSDEPQRLASLRQLDVLDTAIEARFERITKMVCRVLDVPISAVSLIDEKRQWFKSVQGLSVRETPRGIAFCPHAIVGEEIMVVSDAHADPRFSDNPLVVNDPHIVFYAGQPIHAPDGSKVGTLCAIDKKPRTLTADQMQTLKELAAMVEVELRALIKSEIRQGLMTEAGIDPTRRP